LKPRIYLSPPHLGEEELKLVTEAFASNWIAPLGPHVDNFEKEMAQYLGVQGTVALSSGTAALHLALKAIGIERGDRVFCSSFTFIGGASPILYEGATPVFIDSDPESWNMSPSALAAAFRESAKAGKLPKAVVVANLYGHSALLKPIGELCEQYGVPVIEDAAESLGATYHGRKSGTFGKFGILSFNGNKIITTSGGGMLVGNDLKALEKARFWATQSRDPAPHYQHSELGFNYRLSNVLAAIGRGQLRLLDRRVAARRAVFSRYLEALSDISGVTFMPETAHSSGTRWLTVLSIDPRRNRARPSEVIDALAKENIEARPTWKPLHQQPIFRGTEYFPHDSNHSVSDFLFETGVCLPSGSSLSVEDQIGIVQIVRRVLESSQL